MKRKYMLGWKRTSAMLCAAVMAGTLLASCGTEWEFSPELESGLEDNTLELTVGENAPLETVIRAVPALEADKELSEEEQEELDALAEEQAKAYLEAGTFTFESADPTVASVDDQGIVTAEEVGETTITVTLELDAEQLGEGDEMAYSPIELAVTVKVNPILPEQVAVDKAEVTLTEGESVEVKATVTPDNTTDPAVIWKSSDETIATVKDGKITAVKAGTATITASAKADEAVKAEIKVTVEAKPEAAQGGSSSSGGSYSGNGSSGKSSGGSSNKGSSGTIDIPIRNEYDLGGTINGENYDSREDYNNALDKIEQEDKENGVTWFE